MPNVPLSRHVQFGRVIKDLRRRLDDAIVEASKSFGLSAKAVKSLERAAVHVENARSALDSLACEAVADLDLKPTRCYYGQDPQRG